VKRSMQGLYRDLQNLVEHAYCLKENIENIGVISQLEKVQTSISNILLELNDHIDEPKVKTQ